MKIAGLDLSITSSGVTIFDVAEDYRINSVESFGFTETKKYSDENIVYYQSEQFNCQYDKFLFMISHIVEWVKDCEYVAVEDYAYGATGAIGRIFDLGEFEGFIKISLFDMGKKLRFYPIPQIKKFFTGFGQADKISMYESFNAIDELKPDLSSLPTVTNGKGTKTVSDIVDSYAICYMLLTELKYRAALKVDSKYDEWFEGTKKKPGWKSQAFIGKESS